MMIYSNKKEMMDHMNEVNGRVYPKLSSGRCGLSWRGMN